MCYLNTTRIKKGAGEIFEVIMAKNVTKLMITPSHRTRKL